MPFARRRPGRGFRGGVALELGLEASESARAWGGREDAAPSPRLQAPCSLRLLSPTCHTLSSLPKIALRKTAPSWRSKSSSEMKRFELEWKGSLFQGRQRSFGQRRVTH